MIGTCDSFSRRMEGSEVEDSAQRQALATASPSAEGQSRFRRPMEIEDSLNWRAVEFRGLTAKGEYCWIEEVLTRLGYHRLRRSEKGVIRRSFSEG